MMYAWEKTLPDINKIPASVVLQKDFRWSRCDIKMTSLLGNVMANEFAMAHDCYETVFERDGILTEASHSNVFFVKNGIVYTHPADCFILDGITRQVVLELCEKLGIEVRLEGLLVKDIPNIEEAFLTGTSTQVLAIQNIDDHVLSGGQAGPLTQKLQQAFLDLKKSLG